MGHKVHPNGFRLGVSRTWNAKWYADRDYTDLLKEDLVVVEARADEGPTIKRFRPRAQGRAFAIHKPMTHITVIVAEREA